MYFKADAFTHTMTSYMRKRERERNGGMAEEEGGRGLKEVLMSIVGSRRGSLKGGSGMVTLLGGSVES